jgi:hypothetical protein
MRLVLKLISGPMSIVFFWVVTSCSLVGSNQGYEGTYQIKVKALRFSVTFVTTYKTARRHNAEDHNQYLNYHENHKSQILISSFSSGPWWVTFRSSSVIEFRGRVVGIPASYSGGPGLNSRSGDRVSWLMIFVVFISLARPIPGLYFRSDHDRFFPHPFKYYLIIQSVPQRKHHTSPLQRSTG